MEVIQFGSQMMVRDMGIGQQYNVLYYCNSKECECESAFYFVFSYRHHPSKEYKSLIQQSHPPPPLIFQPKPFLTETSQCHVLYKHCILSFVGILFTRS